MDAFHPALYIVPFLLAAAAGVFIFITVDYFRLTKGAHAGALVAIWCAAAAGSLLGSFLTGLLGVMLATVMYPNTNEYGAAVVGSMFGSCLSVPVGIFVGSGAGTLTADLLLRLRGRRPAWIAGSGAFLAGALAAGVSLVPVGFFFYALGHI